MSKTFNFSMREYVSTDEHTEVLFDFKTVVGVYEIVNKFEDFLKACGYDIHSLTVNMDNPKLFEPKKQVPRTYSNMRPQATTGETQRETVLDTDTEEEREYWNKMAETKRETIKKELRNPGTLHHPV